MMSIDKKQLSNIVNLDHAAGGVVNLSYLANIIGVPGVLSNPSSTHLHGQFTKQELDKATKGMIDLTITKNPENWGLVWTSGSTESINHWVKSFIRKNVMFVTSGMEHLSLYESIEWLHKEAEDKYRVLQYDIPIYNKEHDFEIEMWAKTIARGIGEKSIDQIVFCFTSVNNETGDILPFDRLIALRDELSKLVKGTVIFIDHTQGIYDVDLPWDDIDLCCFSGHKLGTFTGIGGLFYKKFSEKHLNKFHLISGGGQQNGLRSGTVNAIQAIATYEYLKEMLEHKELSKKFNNEDNIFIKNHLQSIADELGLKLVFNHSKDSKQSDRIINFSMIGIEGESFVSAVADVCSLSTKSACNSDSLDGSHVLEALNIPKHISNCAVRLSLPLFTDLSIEKKYGDSLFDKIKERIEPLARCSVKDIEK